MASAGSAEHSTLVATSNVIINSLSADPLAVARKLYARGWIPQGVLASVRMASKTDEVKATELVELIINKVGDFPEYFELFLEIIGEDPCLKDLLKLIRKNYEENIQSRKMEAMPKPERPADNDSDRGPPRTAEDEIDSGVHNGAATKIPHYDEKKQEDEYRANMPKPGKAGDAQLKKFCSEVKIILHTVNPNEFQAAITFMKPPMETLKRPVKYCHESDMVVYLGIFAGKKTVLIQTKPGADCREEIEEVLEAYHTAQYVFAVGVCYGFNRKKVKLGDIIVSQKISDFANYKYEEGKIIKRGKIHDVKPFLFNNFCKDLIYDPIFVVTTDNCPSKVHSGLIMSPTILFKDIEMRDKFHAAEPEAIGGEMEGGVVMQLLTKEKYKGKGVIVIKGVADYGDGNKDDVWQYTAAKAALHYTWSKLNEPPEVSAED